MTLPLPISYAAAEAESVGEIPQGPEWWYEPKWDGFRCLAFRDGDTVDLRSKAGKPLGRYFPDVVQALLAVRAKRFVLDGEIVVPVDGNLSFDELQLRLHPAESRVRKLAAAHPATFIVFDLLLGPRGNALNDAPLEVRRTKLEEFAAQFMEGSERLALSPRTTDVGEAGEWLQAGGGLDGVIAKRADLAYQTGERTGMVKIKNMRTAECVVGGFRYASKGHGLGSLLLGLYDNAGLLNHVGFCSAMDAELKKETLPRLEALRGAPGFTGDAPGAPSRWTNGRSTEWEPLRTELVVEVRYDHFTGGRFRHGTQFMRWRPDKEPRQCRMEQVEKESRSSMRLIAR
ncbi:MAG TPA: ATP-dependent DNA ligase [Longimicrobiaceae bacterium]|nr:ATP-dependent DNA ligase [Longimicrobiaceae bacterium]